MSGTAGHPTPVQGQHAIALLPCPQTVGSTGRFRRVASQARDVPGQHVIGGFGGASLAGDPNNYSGWHGRVDLVTPLKILGARRFVGGGSGWYGTPNCQLNRLACSSGLQYFVSRH